MIRKIVACLVLCLASLPALKAAQSSQTTGILTGTVRDVSGAVIPGTVVAARSVDTNQTQRSSTSEDGNYRFVSLPVGDYEIRAEIQGFGQYVNPTVTVILGRTSVLDIILNPAGVSQSVAVTDQPRPIDTSATATTTTIDPERIEESPVNSRNYLEFTLLAPGVAASNAQSKSTALADSGFTFGGLRPRSNSISIDGLDNTDETTGSARVALSPEIVREFQIINSGLSAESGGAAGGAINVVTKTGTNDIHGDAFLFGQNEIFNAEDTVTAKAGTGTPRFRRYQPGFALGGPVRHDRLFFYVAGEQEHLSEDSASEISPATRTQINASLNSGTVPGASVRSLQSGRFPAGADETEAAGKLTYLTGRHTLNSRLAFTNSRLRSNAFNTEEINDLSARGSSYIKDYQLTGADVIALSSAVIAEFRFQGSTRYAASNAGDRQGPGIDIAGIARFGRPFDAESSRRENRGQIIDNITIERGHHEIKTGITLNHVGLHSQMKDGFGGLFTFRTLDDFVAGHPAQWRQAFGQAATDFGVTGFGGFLQDRYQPARSVTLNAGFRYDIERLPASFPTRLRNISPRVGLAWSPTNAWVVRSGFGVYYDRVPLAFVNRAIQKDGVHAYEQITGPIAAVVFSSNAPAQIAPSRYAADPAFATPYSLQANSSVERLVSKDVTVRADYLYTRGIHLLRTRNINLLPPSPGPDGRLLFGPTRIDSRFDAIYQLESSAASTYHGLTLSLNKRLSNEFELLASHTWSKALDDASDFDEQPQNPYNLRAEHSLSRQDVRHRFVVSALFDLPIGPDEEDLPKGATPPPPTLIGKLFGHIEAAPIFTFSSGRPVNPLTGADDEMSRAYPFASRPLGVGRNSFRTPQFVNADLRVVKYIPYGGIRRLDFVTEAFNLFNHPNILAVNGIYGPGATPLPTFGGTQILASPRQIRFSIDFEF